MGQIHMRFTVVGRPQQRGSKTPYRWTAKDGRSGIAMTDSNRKSTDWIQAVRDAASEAMGGRDLFHGPIQLIAEFFFARPKVHFRTGKYAGKLAPSAPEYHTQSPDLDKLLRAIGDGMTGVVYRDDRQICVVQWVAKNWTKIEECAVITVTAITGD